MHFYESFSPIICKHKLYFTMATHKVDQVLMEGDVHVYKSLLNGLTIPYTETLSLTYLPE